MLEVEYGKLELACRWEREAAKQLRGLGDVKHGDWGVVCLLWNWEEGIEVGGCFRYLG